MTNLIKAAEDLLLWDDESETYDTEALDSLPGLLDALKAGVNETEGNILALPHFIQRLRSFRQLMINADHDAEKVHGAQHEFEQIVQDMEAAVVNAHIDSRRVKEDGPCPNCGSNVYHEASCSLHGWTPEPEKDSESQGHIRKFTGIVVEDDDDSKSKGNVEGDDDDPACGGCGKPMSEHNYDMPDYIRRLLSQDPEKMVELQGEEKKQMLEDLGRAFSDRIGQHRRGGSRADSPLMGHEQEGHDDLPSPKQLVNINMLMDALLEVTGSHQSLADQVLRMAKGLVNAGGYENPEARIRDIEAGLKEQGDVDIPYFKESIDTFVEQFKEVREHMEVEETMVARLVTTDQRALALKEQVDRLTTLYEGLKGWGDAIQKEHHEREERVDEVQRRTAVLEGRADGVSDRLAAVEKDLKEQIKDTHDLLQVHLGNSVRHSPGTTEASDQEAK